MNAPVLTTLVTGVHARAREAAIAAYLAEHHSPSLPAVILEGLAPGASPLDAMEGELKLARIAPGCLCCAGNLVLRVTLNRLLRQRPERLFIGVARSEHLDQLRSWLQSEPYDQLLRLTPDLDAQENS
jgi:G3E family GTPase